LIPAKELRRGLAYVARWTGWQLSELMELEVQELAEWIETVNELAKEEYRQSKA
jgi:hypothetical protein